MALWWSWGEERFLMSAVYKRGTPVMKTWILRRTRRLILVLRDTACHYTASLEFSPSVICQLTLEGGWSQATRLT